MRSSLFPFSLCRRALWRQRSLSRCSLIHHCNNSRTHIFTCDELNCLLTALTDCATGSRSSANSAATAGKKYHHPLPTIDADCRSIVKSKYEDFVHAHTHKHSRSITLSIKVALVISLCLVVVEFTAGTISHSLALISDGWHNLSDLPTLSLAWIALYFERKPPNLEKTFGYQRAGVLAAFVNALLLAIVAASICVDGYHRLLHPETVSETIMIRVGILALVINTFITLALSRDRHDLNLRALFLHNLGDALSNIAIIAGAWLIRVTGEPLIDPVIAFLIAGMILWTAKGILADSTNILLESLPKGMTLENVARAMLTVEGVREVHDVHIWSLGSQSHALSCHVQILDMPTSESEVIADKVREVLAHEFEITHSTIQFEHTHPPGDFHRYMPAAAPTGPK